ncbi:ATP-binding protein [Photobacterium alginatilyticum]|uniref:ATP-binding protein n=1 Tax=Photobacterium alginatilyticum TaxID=1775171 RepID=UPI0040683800
MQTRQFAHTRSIKQLLTYSALFIVLLLAAFFYTEQTLNNTRTQLISLEIKILDASNEMLMMRRHEKDFFARVDSNYLDKMKSAYNNILISLNEINKTIEENNITTAYTPQVTLESVNTYYQNFTTLSEILLIIRGEGDNDGLIDKLKDHTLTLEKEVNKFQSARLDELTLSTQDLMYRFFSDFDASILREIDTTFIQIKNEIGQIPNSQALSLAFDDFTSSFYQLQRAYKVFGYNHNQGRHGELRNTIHALENKLDTLFSVIPLKIKEKLASYEIYKLLAGVMLCLSIITTLLYVVRKTGRLERALISAREHEKQANKAKSAFLANMSHEIRTPLNGILGMTEILSDSRLTAIQKDYLSTINASSQTLLMLINDILDLSKIESGHLEICPHTCAIKEILFDTAALIAPKAQQKSIDINIELDPLLPNYIKADEQKVRQVIMNLASNAIKFTETGSITFSAKLVTQTNLSTTVYFSVTDTGIGIDESKQEHIFDEFKQENADTSAQYGGTGLGLAISSKMVSLMGGNIQLASSKGQGSQFYFEIKFDNDEQRLSTEDPIDIVYFTNSVNTLLIQEIQRFGYRPTVVKHSSTIPTSLQQAGLILVDSLDLLQAIERRYSQYPVIFVRRNTENINSNSHNVTAFVTSPLFGTRLRNTLSAALNHDLPEPESQPSTPQTLKRKVLIVEDNKVNQKVACINLKKIGLDYILANNGQEAIECYKHHHKAIGLILMDCMMPVLNGFDATRAIRKFENDNEHPRTHIVALTASILDDDIQKCFDCGMDDYLPKPFKREVLIEKLDKQVGQMEEL